MKFTGNLIGVSESFLTGKPRITLEINEAGRVKDSLSLRDLALDIELKRHRKKRSLDANALMWQCLGEIAHALNQDKWNIYLMMLKRYGKYTYICVKPEVVEAVKSQWRECEVVGDISINGQKAVQLLCYFGSSTYNTKEFSTLLDGIISEMEEMGLERPLDGDMKRALEQWEKAYCNKKESVISAES